MIIKNADHYDLHGSLSMVNTRYGNNIKFSRLDLIDEGWHVTLRVIDTKGLGAGRSVSGRRTGWVCWHVHRDFFDFLFEFRQGAVIIAQDKIITSDQRNWMDRNRGSTMQRKLCACQKQNMDFIGD